MTVHDKDREMQADDGLRHVDKLSIINERLQNGKCSVKIESLTEAEFGTWACTLFGQTNVVFPGQVEISSERSDCSH